jgi:HEAT repeat protein
VKTLLDAATGDPRKGVRKHAALALTGYEGPHAAVARKKVEDAAVAEKDPEVRRALAYALAYIGDAKSVAVLEKLLAAEDSERGAAFVRGAIARLKGPEGGEDRFKDSARWLLGD